MFLFCKTRRDRAEERYDWRLDVIRHIRDSLIIRCAKDERVDIPVYAGGVGHVCSAT